ncbi:hypothetical protein PR001_g5906 [Phytophthora rubi]|uniref:Tc1-like transposase DDE domain-containing protein n=1 Tax=Phytophthora rubi TaxID=129364 RepID=A0A6A3NCR5_9STRA|nr:hypothetical protein PR001_g5906 [Phytophthora rubi]
MEEAVTRQHAHPNTVFHCLYGFYCLGHSRKELARIYKKTVKTIGNWINVYERTGTYQRADSKVLRRFTAAHQQWLCDYYAEHPLAYLDEAQDAILRAHAMTISISSVWRIIHDAGLTRKVLERRAMHIKELVVFRFVEELAQVNWCHSNLVFLDKVLFDNRGMIRKRGYSLKGQTIAIRGDFQRKPRVSVLAFMGVTGIIDYYDTQGTFDRVDFFQCCQDFAYSTRGNVRQYPGSNSVWILDGASIHRDPEIIHFLRSVGIVPIFLPAYCPFFNPIEYMFGYIKRSFQRHYVESSSNNLLPFVAETFGRFENFSMSKVFEHCGWNIQGHFDPCGQLEKDSRNAAGVSNIQAHTNEEGEQQL